MKYLLCLSFLILVVVAFSSCDNQMKGVMKPVVEEVTDEQPTEPEMPADTPMDMAEMPAEMMVEIDDADLPLIESTELEPGLYRMNIESGAVSSRQILYISMRLMPEVEENVYVKVILHPYVPDPNHTNFIGAEVVVQIYAKTGVEENRFGSGKTYHNYHGSVIKILKQPTKGEIDYAYQPTGYEDLPALRVAFQAGSIQPGQYLMFARIIVQRSKIISLFSEIPESDVRLRVLLDQQPWAVDDDNNRISVRGVVVEITEILDVKVETVGRREITYHDFQGILLKNFSYPDIPIEYEEDATE